MTAVDAPATAVGQIQTWGDDPGEPGTAHPLIARPKPNVGAAPLPTQIDAPEPATDGAVGSPAFRYWVAAEAVRRASDLWGATIGPSAAWNPAVGPVLGVKLDEGVDLNAYYDRAALNFFHAEVHGTTCHSVHSPHVATHEFGHGVLDGLRPQLWDAPFAEVPAFHEAFGDMSSILCALQLEPIREAVLSETEGRVGTNSVLSRLAQQLGWCVRQLVPDAVDRDALRNAANSWFYRDPAQLSPGGPAFQLSSEPHSFSRVFSGAFLSALGGMFVLRGEPTADGLHGVSTDAAKLLRSAAVATPVVPAYMSQVAAHMVAADAQLFNGRYRRALIGAFLGHGILSLPATQAVSPSAVDAALSAAGGGFGELEAPQLQRVTLPAAAFGLTGDLIVETPVQERRFGVAGSTPDLGSADVPTPGRAAASFVEDIFRRGRVELGDFAEDAPLVRPGRPKSHELVQTDDGIVLRRRHFDCGFAAE